MSRTKPDAEKTKPKSRQPSPPEMNADAVLALAEKARSEGLAGVVLARVFRNDFESLRDDFSPFLSSLPEGSSLSSAQVTDNDDSFAIVESESRPRKLWTPEVSCSRRTKLAALYYPLPPTEAESSSLLLVLLFS